MFTSEPNSNLGEKMAELTTADLKIGKQYIVVGSRGNTSQQITVSGATISNLWNGNGGLGTSCIITVTTLPVSVGGCGYGVKIYGIN